MIEVQNLHCGYAGQPVLQGISLQIRRGELVGILGPNGSGKTTLLLTLSGIVPVQAGRILLQGGPLTAVKPRERARRMAAVAQNEAMRFPFCCEEVVHMGRYPHQKRWQMDSLRDREVVERAMLITDTQAFARRLITALSGGEKQRVVMAKALAQETPLLLLDEATSAMDIHRKLQMFRLLEGLNREELLTVVTVSHDVNLAALFCRRLIFLKDGRIAADGPTDEVLTAEVLEAVYETPVLVQQIGATGKQQVVFLP